MLWWFAAYAFGTSFVLAGGAYADNVQDQFIKLLEMMLILWAGLNLVH